MVSSEGEEEVKKSKVLEKIKDKKKKNKKTKAIKK